MEILSIATYSHEYYLSQKANLQRATVRYREAHRPALNERRRAFYLANRERLRAKQREYNALNKERRCERAKLDADRHFFRIRAGNLKVRHGSAGPTATKFDIAKLWKRQRGICPFTGVRLNRTNAQLDHIVPAIRGGSGKVENLRWILRDANYAKRDLTDAQFLALCEQVVSYRKERS